MCTPLDTRHVPPLSLYIPIKQGYQETSQDNDFVDDVDVSLQREGEYDDGGESHLG